MSWSTKINELCSSWISAAVDHQFNNDDSLGGSSVFPSPNPTGHSTWISKAWYNHFALAILNLRSLYSGVIHSDPLNFQDIHKSPLHCIIIQHHPSTWSPMMIFDFDSSALIISFMKKRKVHHSWNNIKGGRKNKKPINRIWSKKGLLSNSFLWVINFF